jgi:formylmethanofuran dehydrogenase subunit B
MDEVPLPLRPALKPSYLTDEEVLKRIVAAVRAKPAWYAAGRGGAQIA